MKNLFLVFSMMMLVLTSCEKNKEVEAQLQDNEKNALLAEAKELSAQHDYYVNEILFHIDESQMQKAKGHENSDIIAMEVVFDAIEQVSGVRPMVLEESNSKEGVAKIKAVGDLPVYDFDEDFMNLSDYNCSKILEPYYARIDAVVSDEQTGIEDKIMTINFIQREVSNNKLVNKLDTQNFLNTTEVLKGSIGLWSTYVKVYDIDNFGSKILLAKPMTQWSFLAKLAFVSAADAVGAIVGNFIGGYIIIKGIPVYVPAGPQGSVIGLATLSILAAKMVGW